MFSVGNRIFALSKQIFSNLAINHNPQTIKSIAVFLILSFGFFYNFEFCDAKTIPSGDTEPKTISELYTFKSPVHVGKSVVIIPTYLPDSTNVSPLYWTSEIPIKSQHINIYFGDKGCIGQHYCTYASFFRENYTGTIKSILNKHINLKTGKVIPSKEISLTKGIKGYYIRGACYAYCNENQLYWLEKHKIYSIGSNASSNIKEFIKSANSVIKQSNK